MVESTMKRYPTADSLKGWGYAKSLYLYGVYLVYLRTKDPRYLEHVKSWIDLHIDDKGTINRPINALYTTLLRVAGQSVDRFNMSDQLARKFDAGSGPLKEVLV